MMASTRQAEWVKERISCAVCKNICDQPNTLTCLHTLCNACLAGIEVTQQKEEDGYECPLCNEFSIKEKVRQNVFISDLTALYKVMTSQETKQGCKQCKEGTPVQRCIECKADFCGKCKDLHDSFEILKSHRSIELKEPEEGEIIVDKLVFCPKHADKLMDLNCVTCEKTVCSSCNAQDHRGHSCETAEDALERILPDIRRKQTELPKEILEAKFNREAVTKIGDKACDAYEAMKKEARNNHAKLKQRLDNDLKKLIDQIDEMQGKVREEEDRHNARAQRGIKQAERIDQCLATTMSAARGNSLLHEIQSGTRAKFLQVLDEVKTARLTFSKDIACASNFDATLAIEQNTVGQITQIASKKFPFALKSINSTQWKMKHNWDIPAENVGRAAKIGGNLWVPTEKNDNYKLFIYNIQGKIMDEKSFASDTGVPRAVVPLPFPTVQRATAVMPTLGGLYLLDESGAISSKLSSKKFADACTYGFDIYALDYLEQTVFKFSVNDGVWTESESMKLDYDTGSSDNEASNTIVIMNGMMFIYTLGKDMLFKYTLSGKQLERFGGEGRCSVPGLMYVGRMSGFDTTGTLLICDQDNCRLQSLSRKGEWNDIHLEENNLSYKPTHAAPIDERSFVIIDKDKVARYYVCE